jgi:hypothetical protein
VRALRNDFTVAHNRKLYQVEKSIPSKEVTVEERINGTMLITHNDEKVPFREITARPEKQPKLVRTNRHRKRHSPSVNHPWNKYNGMLFRHMRGQSKRPMAATT